MKQLFYFLTGVLISCLILTESYAECFDPGNMGSSSPDNTATGYGGNVSYISNYSSASAAGAQANADLNERMSTHPQTAAPPLNVKYANPPQNTEGYFYFKEASDGVWTGIAVYPFSSSSDGVCPNLGQTDSDGDGIPDDQDMYPNDPKPYNVKLVSYWTDDGSPTGNHIYEVWITDKGDYYSVGEKPDDTTNGFFTYNDSSWIPASDSPTNGDGSVNTGDGRDVVLQQPPTSTGTPSGNAPTDTDPTLKPGEKSDGTETDNEALKGIKDNTGDIASNTKRLGEYTRDLNTAIQNMNRNISVQTDALLEQEENRLKDESEAKQEADAFSSKNVSDYYNDTNFKGELTEGTDYEPAKDLTEESWFVDFMTSNPLSTAYSNSGFSTSGGSPQMTFTINGMGTHKIDLGPFDSQFSMAGALLLSLTSLLSLIIIAWR